MLSPLVSWILPSSSSSSSSSSSEGEDKYVTDEGDHYENVGENEHFLNEADEFPSTSCACDTIPGPVDASPSVTAPFPGSLPHDSSVIPNTQKQKRRRINNSRRLWTKQDEIQVLRGYLDYIKKHRWATTSLQNDVAFFHDHVRPKLKTSFDKSQLVHKLRGLKRKHKIALDKINSGRDVSHKNPEEEAIFQISDRIWGKNRDQESSSDPDDTDNVEVDNEEDDDGNEMESMKPRRKRSRETTNEDNTGIQRLVEETMRSCLSPMLKEGSALSLVEQYGNGDEKCRTKRILELEMYLKQLESLQEQIKGRIEELRSSGG